MKRRTLLKTLSSGSLLIVLIGPTASLAQDVTLRGTVLDSAGNPLRGAQLEFSPGPYVAVSDRNGRFLVPGFRHGSYSITVRGGGKYQVLKVEIPNDAMTLHVNW